MKQVRIYQKSKSPLQSGRAHMHEWHLEFISSKKQVIYPLMDWIGSTDPSQQIHLKFKNKAEAIAYALSHGLAYELED